MLFIYRLELYALFINEKIRMASIDSDVLYIGTFYRRVDCTYTYILSGIITEIHVHVC